MNSSRLWLIALALCAGLASAAEEPSAVERQMRQRLLNRPGDADARFGLARALAHQLKYKAAASEYGRLLKAYPANPDYLLGMAQVKLWSGQPQEALPYLAQARRLAPRYADVWRAEIQAQLALENDSHARRLRGEAQRQFPAEDWAFPRLDAPAVSPPSAANEAVAPAPPATTVVAPPPPQALPTGAPTATIPAAAVRSSRERTEIEAGVSHEYLTRGLPAWRSRYLLGEHRNAEDTTLYGGLRETNRYALIDREVHAGIGMPLAPSLRIQAEIGASDTHHILPTKYGALQFQHQPAAGWTLTGGWRRSAYDLGMTGVLHLGADRYLGDERFSYTLYSGGPDGSGRAPSHRLQWAHYYGDRDWAGISVNTGRETENLGGASFLTARVHGVGLSGRHGLDDNWSLTWEAGRIRQGEAHTRSGMRLGLRYAF